MFTMKISRFTVPDEQPVMYYTQNVTYPSMHGFYNMHMCTLLLVTCTYPFPSKKLARKKVMLKSCFSCSTFQLCTHSSIIQNVQKDWVITLSISKAVYCTQTNSHAYLRIIVHNDIIIIIVITLNSQPVHSWEQPWGWRSPDLAPSLPCVPLSVSPPAGSNY